MTMLHPTSLLLALALTTAAAAQSGWTQPQPFPRPLARTYHSMTYDVIHSVTVLFGGWDGTALDDTWEWTGANWTRRVTTVTPPARLGNALAVDIGRARVVLFGGAVAPQGADLNDTWEFDGTNWTQRHPLMQPTPRRMVRMEYDAARGQTVLFGGGAGNGLPSFNDTWVWDGFSWTQRNPATVPPARWGQGMAYDFKRARIVLFGGNAYVQSMSDTWTWDGTNWTQLLANTPAETAFGFANDPTRDVGVRFGGVSVGDETWLFDGVAWRRDARTPAPQLRSWCTLAHDLIRGRTVMFGGSFSTYLDDTWEYDPGIIARWRTSGGGCAGTAGVPVLRPVAASLPIVGTTFQLELLGIPGNAAAISYGFSNTQWNGGALPFDLGAFGMTGCTLHANPEFVFFTPATAGRATFSWPLPNAASLIGVQFFNQGFVLDPGINPTGATVSNGGAGVIGPF